MNAKLVSKVVSCWGLVFVFVILISSASAEVTFLNKWGSGDFVLMPAGTFIILCPQDAHIPGTNVDQPSPVRKVVIKVQRND